MGIIRLYLAFCVAGAHATSVFPWRTHAAMPAVQMFFVISGFYMALVLSERYDSARVFYRSRFLKLFPAYWLIWTGVLIWCLVAGLIWNEWFTLTPYFNSPLKHTDEAAVTFAVLSNATIFGQDWLMFVTQPPDQPPEIIRNLRHVGDEDQLHRFLLVPQAWSLALELCFYLMAPWLNRLKTRWLLGIAALSLGGKIYLISKLNLWESWEYRFFPFELGLFVFGMLAYRLHLRLGKWAATGESSLSRLQLLAGAAVMLFALRIHVEVSEHLQLYLGEQPGTLLAHALFAVAISAVFICFKSQPLDRAIGELSYPVYLLHYIVMLSITPVFIKMNWSSGKWGPASAAISVLLALLLQRLFVQRWERKRYARAGLSMPAMA